MFLYLYMTQKPLAIIYLKIIYGLLKPIDSSYSWYERVKSFTTFVKKQQ